MKKTLFITMLAAALLGGNVYADTSFSGGHRIWGAPGTPIVAIEGETLRIFEYSDPSYPSYPQLGDVYGLFNSGTGMGGSVAIQGGIVQNAYGGYIDGPNIDTASCKVKMTGGTVLGKLRGGGASSGSNGAYDNLVIVTGGWIGESVIGGEASGEDCTGADGNKVYVTGLSTGCTPDIFGGLASGNYEANARENQVHLVGEGAGILLDNESYVGQAMTLGAIQGGFSGYESRNNSIDIYGSGIQAVSLTHMQILNFHLVEGLATAEAPMVSLSGTGAEQGLNMANFTLGIIADDVTDWGLLAGRTVTLAETQLAITGFGRTPYKVVDVTKTGQSASKGILTLGNEGKELRLKVLRPGIEVLEVLTPGDSRQAGRATITALKENEPGLLGNLALSTDIILGAGRDASLADGLKIQSDADLMIKNMTITANNEIHVGENTITLNQVTIDLSQAKYELVGSDYYFQLQDLINCTLEMDDVVFDASALELPEGFDPATTSVVFDFGDDVTIRQATGLDMRLGNYWSPSLNLDEQGKVIFTKLVETPEPTTGTLSLLALAALAARRRRK